MGVSGREASGAGQAFGVVDGCKKRLQKAYGAKFSTQEDAEQEGTTYSGLVVKIYPSLLMTVKYVLGQENIIKNI